MTLVHRLKASGFKEMLPKLKAVYLVPDDRLRGMKSSQPLQKQCKQHRDFDQSTPAC